MKLLVLFISLCWLCWVTAHSATKEELRQQTEAMIRVEQERKRRLRKNEVLDNNAEIYYDGNNTYPGLVIDGSIYPAIIKNNYRYPACLNEGNLLQGVYERQSKQVVCRSERQDFSTREKKSKTVTKSVRSSFIQTQSLTPSMDKIKVVNSQVMEVNSFKETQNFGIRAGTWARVYLARAVSSSEPTDIELELLEDITGKFKTLPAGTIFFTRHQINPATQRLDMNVVLMVLPDGTEFQVSATIHGSGKTAGLAGAIVTYTDQHAKSSARHSIFAGTQQAIDKVVINNPFASVAGDLAQEMVESKKQALPFVPQFSVHLSPQKALIRFGRSF